MITECYITQTQRWPRSGRHALAQFDAQSVVLCRRTVPRSATRGLPDAVSMKTRAGISPSVPHEVEVLKTLKSWKNEQPGAAKQPLGQVDPVARIDSK